MDLIIFRDGKFQSTLPVKGATASIFPSRNWLSFQSTLPVKGATVSLGCMYQHRCVSIHAPGEGSDLTDEEIEAYLDLFQSTLPVKGATKHFQFTAWVSVVSIHAPGEGSDNSLFGFRK